MSRNAVHQHHLLHRGRSFHFVAYGAEPANPARGTLATPATWFLMSSGKRWEVMPEVAELPEPERDRQFTRWLDQHVFA